jgi:hypothetical protein
MVENTTTEDGQPPFAQPIQLVGGINFATWPDLKWSRGSSHVALLESKFREWHASAPVSIDAVLRKDRLGFDLVTRVPKGIPKHEWSLDLGDALHNLRSAFDAAAWGMAHFNGNEPTRPKSVYFPICTEEKQWTRAVRDWVGELDPELQERLRVMQPLYYMPAGGVSVLSMLHELDVQDKHRDILTVSADVDGIDVGGSFEYEHDTPAMPQVEMLPDIKFGDGAVLGTIHAGAPIRMVGRMILRPTIKVQLTYRDTTYDVMPMLQQFVTETRRYLDILMFGFASPDLSGATDGSDLEVGSPPA